MIKHLYIDFLEEYNVYGLTIGYWSKYFKYLCLKYSIEKTDWANTKFVNGYDFRDGNPIYSFLVPKRKKAIRIIQKQPKHNEPYIKIWFKEYDEIPNLTNYNVVEMVISLELSIETKDMVSQLFTSWIIDNKSVQSMDDIVNNITRNN